MAVVGSNTSPFNFSTAIPPLTPEASQIYADRRRQARTGFNLLSADVRAQSRDLEASDILSRSQLRNDIARQVRSGMVTASARGLGMAPMFAGRLRRESARYQQESEAQMEAELTARLNELQRSLLKAELDRDRELLSISSQEAANRMAMQLAMVGQYQ